jgi:branched-subunit amino acid ABC-type transport system permease component
MAFEEKRAWIMAVVSVVAFAVYAAIILVRAGSAPLRDTPYVSTMLWTIGISIVVSILLHIVAAITSGADANKKDVRDREIYRFGDTVGQVFVFFGAVAAMGLAMAQVSHFWIANVIYLGFALGSALGSLAKVAAYRDGIPDC